MLASAMRRIFPVLLLLFVPAAAAQTNTFRLDESGNWVAAPSRPLTPDEETIAEARRLLAENKPAQARTILTAWIDRHAATDHPLLPQAYLLRGDAHTAAGNEYKALYDYETVAIGFPASEEYMRALEREMEIAIKYLYGLRRRWLGVRWSDATADGQELLARVAERAPGSKLAERSIIELADYYYRERELKTAAEAYEIFLANFPRSPLAEHARRRRIEANIGRFKGPNYDAAGLGEARVLIEDLRITDPITAERMGADALLARLDESAAAQVLEKARWYLQRRDLVSARFTLQRLVQKHPQTVSARTAIQMLQERGWALPTSPGNERSRTEQPAREEPQPAPAPEAPENATPAPENQP